MATHRKTLRFHFKKSLQITASEGEIGEERTVSWNNPQWTQRAQQPLNQSKDSGTNARQFQHTRRLCLIQSRFDLKIRATLPNQLEDALEVGLDLPDGLLQQPPVSAYANVGHPVDGYERFQQLAQRMQRSITSLRRNVFIGHSGQCQTKNPMEFKRNGPEIQHQALGEKEAAHQVQLHQKWAVFNKSPLGLENAYISWIQLIEESRQYKNLCYCSAKSSVQHY